MSVCEECWSEAFTRAYFATVVDGEDTSQAEEYARITEGRGLHYHHDPASDTDEDGGDDA